MNSLNHEIKSKMPQTNSFKEKLKRLMDEYIQFIYTLSSKFPKDELYGVTSQIRRASISIILNYIEGFARRKSAVQLNFLEISYGSTRESRYLVYFANKQNWITKEEYEEGMSIVQEIGAMLWTEIRNLDKKVNK